jgi:hypothetical protein
MDALASCASVVSDGFVMAGLNPVGRRMAMVAQAATWNRVGMLRPDGAGRGKRRHVRMAGLSNGWRVGAL